MNGEEKNGINQIWRMIAVTSIGAMAGWWSSRLTLEIPPAWFRQDVQDNTADIRNLDSRVDTLEKQESDKYSSLVDKVLELDKKLRDK